MDKLRAEGFDICILNWGDAKRNLYENALVLREAINYINANKQGNEELVILGPSMGGLLTRYVLAKMEQENTPHHTRLYISFDSPHQGANMPLGYQHLIDYMLDNADLFTFGLIQEIEDFRQQLDCDAAKQMLNYHHTATEVLAMDANPTQMKIDFYNELHALNPPYNGYPHLCKKIAIAEGSGNGLDQGFEPNDQLLNWNFVTPRVSIWLPSYSLCFEVKSLPDNHSVGGPKLLFYGHILISPFLGAPYFLFSAKIVYIDNSIPYDNCPGGNYPFHIQLNEKICKWYTIHFSERSHNDCFMPVSTTLDLANGGNVWVNIINGGSNIVRNYPNCPFEEFYIPYDNEPHVVTGITAGMANWLLQNITQGTIFIQNKTISNKIDYNARYRILVGHNVDIFYPRGDVLVLPGGELYLKSGGDILLDDGFYADNGSVFYANIEPYPCPPYVPSFSKSFISTEFNEEKNTSNETTFQNKTENNNENEVTVYPNPTNDIINVEIKNDYNNIIIVIYSISGKKLFEEKIKGKEKNAISVDISNYPSGVYFLKTILDNKTIINKIIKSDKL
ncbi:MAG: hypothetical protein AUJ97_03615 [Bacteroidetes bacterium CG2_30_32_10]|nr:MAG: hypothetical protein AUJ97_03615 [Bacteroidetes bacterium CG2_30_32_10]